LFEIRNFQGEINMTTRIVIPVEDEHGLEAHLAEHFGRAPFFTVFDFENGKISNIKTVPNTGEHFGGTGHPHENLLALKPSVIIARGMGPGGLQSFRNARVMVLKANADTVKEIVESFKQGKLTELTGGCEHAHHHEH
jgi:predicted Fe-Mo cluster-binding NifX family protein